jgi:hypothetical protein
LTLRPAQWRAVKLDNRNLPPMSTNIKFHFQFPP